MDENVVLVSPQSYQVLRISDYFPIVKEEQLYYQIEDATRVTVVNMSKQDNKYSRENLRRYTDLTNVP